MGAFCCCFGAPSVEETVETQIANHESWFGPNVVSKGIASSSSAVVPSYTPVRTECQLSENLDNISAREQLEESNTETSSKINSLGDTNNGLYFMAKQGDYAAEDEDVCPTCFEEYTPENPKIVTQCHHEYHLSCIYEWMERSEKCPICSKLMIFDEPT